MIVSQLLVRMEETALEWSEGINLSPTGLTIVAIAATICWLVPVVLYFKGRETVP